MAPPVHPSPPSPLTFSSRPGSYRSASSFGAYSVCSDRGDKKECTRTPPRQIPEEPMSIVMNTAIGTWNGGQSALDGKHWPAKFYVDYVRVWQHETNIGCDPPDYPTKK